MPLLTCKLIIACKSAKLNRKDIIILLMNAWLKGPLMSPRGEVIRRFWDFYTKLAVKLVTYGGVSKDLRRPNFTRSPSAASGVSRLQHRLVPLPLRLLAGGRREWGFIVFSFSSSRSSHLELKSSRFRVSPCQVSWYWRIISSSSSPVTARGQGGFVFSMADLLKMRATPTSTTSSI